MHEQRQLRQQWRQTVPNDDDDVEHLHSILINVQTDYPLPCMCQCVQYRPLGFHAKEIKLFPSVRFTAINTQANCLHLPLLLLPIQVGSAQTPTLVCVTVASLSSPFPYHQIDINVEEMSSLTSARDYFNRFSRNCERKYRGKEIKLKKCLQNQVLKSKQILLVFFHFILQFIYSFFIRLIFLLSFDDSKFVIFFFNFNFSSQKILFFLMKTLCLSRFVLATNLSSIINFRSFANLLLH